MPHSSARSPGARRRSERAVGSDPENVIVTTAAQVPLSSPSSELRAQPPRLQLVPKHGKSLHLVGLFAGIGGIEIGLAKAGHRTRLLCEIDEAARLVLKQHAGSKPI